MYICLFSIVLLVIISQLMKQSTAAERDITNENASMVLNVKFTAVYKVIDKFLPE